MKNGSSSVNLVSMLKHHYPNLCTRLELFREETNIPGITEPLVPNCSRLRSRMFADITHDVIPIILHEDDINFMTYSVENRSPLLSKQNLLLSLSLRDSDLMEDGYQKTVLREMLKVISPTMSKVYKNRRKQGYNYGILDIYNHNPDKFLEILHADTPLWDLIRKKELQKQIESIKKKDEMLLFAIFSIQAFLTNI